LNCSEFFNDHFITNLREYADGGIFKIKSVNVWRSYMQESLGIFQPKDEELAIGLEFDGQQCC